MKGQAKKKLFGHGIGEVMTLIENKAPFEYPTPFYNGEFPNLRCSGMFPPKICPDCGEVTKWESDECTIGSKTYHSNWFLCGNLVYPDRDDLPLECCSGSWNIPEWARW